MRSMPPTPRREPNPLLAGLTAGVLLFALTLCTISMWFLPTLARQFNLAPGPGQVWTPPPATPLPPVATAPPTIAAADTPAAPPEGEATPVTPDFPIPPGPHTFQPGDSARNVNDGPVNLRRSPGYLNKPANDRIGLAPAGDQVLILEGPRAADDLIWWRVRWQEIEGWMAESRASGGRILAPLASP